MISASDIKIWYDCPVGKRNDARGGSRPGAGRKPILRDSVALTVHVDGSQHAALSRLAEERERSIGSLVREAIMAFLRKKKG